ncbi:hypothetical protein SAHL_13755 [Salinisphaera orenii YIM 95161]|uniref:Uncharacterized protein n=1 Tax=Salinisphaera orenii YIM 95161 TaxID=1051139 RepID=A0A423PJL6_9GAMM|nr:hypothetical protein SAHL_13755 [Salinisphaera halophila YIM 95161]
MRARVDVRIHAQRDRRPHPQTLRDRVDAHQLGLRLDVEAGDADLERALDLVDALAHAGKHHPRRIAAGRDHAFELAHRDDIEAAAQIRQQAEHAEIAVGLHGEADLVVDVGQGRLEDPVMARDRGCAVDIARRAEARRDIGQRHVLGVQHAAAVDEMIHG